MRASVRRSRITTVATGATPGGTISSPSWNAKRSGAGPMALKICCSNHLSNRGDLGLKWMLFLRAKFGWLIGLSFGLAIHIVLGFPGPTIHLLQV